jgi:hypothetical protein
MVSDRGSDRTDLHEFPLPEVQYGVIYNYPGSQVCGLAAPKAMFDVIVLCRR